MYIYYLKGQCREIFCSRFFHDSSSPKPLKIILGSFQILLKIRGDVCKSKCNTGGKFVNGTAGVLKGTVSRDFLLLVFFMNQFATSHRVFH
jgi:hypothetical protein